MGGAGLVQGINKIMFGGLNKMTSGLDKFKTMVEEDFKAGRKKIRGKKSADGDISGNDYSSSGGLISDDEILYSRPPTLTLNSEKSLASTAPGNYNDIISKTRSALLEEDRLFDSGRYESGSVNNFEDMVDDTDQLNRSFDSDRKVGTSGGGAGISGSVFGSLDYLKSTSGNIVDDSMVQHPDDDDDSASNAAPYATGAAAVLEDESEDTNDGEEEEEEQEGEEEENQEFILCEQDNLKTAGFPLSPSSPSPPISPDEIYNHRTSFPVSDEASIFSSESSSSYSPTKTIITNSVSPLMIAHAASSLLNFDYIWNSLKLMYQYIRLLDSDSSHNNPSNISAESQIMEKYEGEYLEEQLLELAIQIFRLNKNYMWAVTQVMFFVKPIAHLFFGRIINK